MNPEIEEPVFGVKAFIAVGGSEAEICSQWADLTNDPLTPDGSHGFVVQGKDGVFLVWLSEDAEDDSLVHEATHLAIGTMRSRRIPIKASNEEVVAYLSAFWYCRLKEVTTSNGTVT